MSANRSYAWWDPRRLRWLTQQWLAFLAFLTMFAAVRLAMGRRDRGN